MEFSPTANYSPEWEALAYFTYGCLLFVLVLWIIHVCTKKDYRGKSITPSPPIEVVPFLAFLGLVAAAIPVAVIFGIAGGEKNDVASANLKQNIMQKYDVQDVDYTFSPYQTNPRATYEQRVLIETKEGKRVIFMLEQNQDTSEPTLLDVPIEAGQNITETISVKDIQK